MRDAFYDLYKKDGGAARRALNDANLKFASLYMLRPEIMKLGLESELSERNSSALRILKELSSRAVDFKARPGDRAVLKWMFDTGCIETGLGPEYDGVMDAIAALLIKTYCDKTCLPGLCDLIFDRHRLGLSTYDAEWAFFECGDPACLELTAKRLLSGDARDLAYAQRLLSFLPCFKLAEEAAAQHKRITQWLRENKPYLCYTGESCLMCSDPCRFKYFPELKYLQRPASDGNGGDLSNENRKRITAFSALDEKTQELLSERSRTLYAGSPTQWKAWMDMPVEQQIKTSRRITGKDSRHGNRRR